MKNEINVPTTSLESHADNDFDDVKITANNKNKAIIYETKTAFLFKFNNSNVYEKGNAKPINLTPTMMINIHKKQHLSNQVADTDKKEVQDNFRDGLVNNNEEAKFDKMFAAMDEIILSKPEQEVQHEETITSQLKDLERKIP